MERVIYKTKINDKKKLFKFLINSDGAINKEKILVKNDSGIFRSKNVTYFKVTQNKWYQIFYWYYI